MALNSTLEEARAIIAQLPADDRIIIEAGTPLIKRYGMNAISRLKSWREGRGAVSMEASVGQTQIDLTDVIRALAGTKSGGFAPAVAAARGAGEAYVVADLKTIDRGETEVAMAAEAGASAAVAMGSAPTETLNTFIAACDKYRIDAMIDMMNVENPVVVLRALKKLPAVVIVHRGVDEERDNREKQIPYHEIQRIKGNFDLLVAVAGGDTIREVQRSFFNDADIAVVWKSFYSASGETAALAEEFLKESK